MAPKPRFLKAKQAFYDNQVEVVRSCHGEMKKRTNALFMKLSSLVEKEIKGTPLSQDELQAVYNSYCKIKYLKDNFEFLRKRWPEVVGNKGPFPEYPEKPHHVVGREFIASFMAVRDINDQRFKCTVDLEPFDTISEDPPLHYIPPVNPMDWSLTANLEEDQGLQLGRVDMVSRNRLRALRQSIRNPSNLDVFGNPVPSTSSNFMERVFGRRNNPPGTVDRANITSTPAAHSRPAGTLGGFGTLAGNDNYIDPRASDDQQNQGTNNAQSGSVAQQASTSLSGGNPNHPYNLRSSVAIQTATPPLINLSPATHQQGQQLRKFNRDEYKDVQPFSGDYLDFMRFFDLFLRIVDEADLDDARKFNYLLAKLDDRSKDMIKDYHCTMYEEVLQVLVAEYTNLPNILSHIQRRATEVPPAKGLFDVKGISAVVERLRSVKILFDYYGLDTGYEIEILKIFAGKLPRELSSKYIARIRNDVPSLSLYLQYLDDGLLTVRNTVQLNPGNELSNRQRGPFSRFPMRRTPARFTPARPSGRGWGGAVNNVTPNDTFLGFPNTIREETVNAVNLQGGHRSNDAGQAVKPKVKKAKPSGVSNPSSGGDRLKPPCSKCGDPVHNIFYCKLLTPEAKLKLARELGVCYVCLKLGHTAHQCTLPYKCVKCGGHHNVQLCKGSNNNSHMTKSAPAANNATTNGKVNYIKQESDYDPFGYNTDLSALFLHPEGMVNNIYAENPERCIPLVFEVGGSQLVGILDTGATVNLIPVELVNKLGLQPYEAKQVLRTPRGPLEIEKAVRMQIVVGKYANEVEFLVYDSQPVILLSIEVFKRFFLIIDYKMRVYQHDQERGGLERLYGPIAGLLMAVISAEDLPFELDQMIKTYEMLFVENSGKIGLINLERCRIHLRNDIPVTLRPYRCTIEEQEIIDRLIRELIEKGLIRRSTSPYSFPVVLVDKKDDGKKSRFCIDCIKLNELTLSEHYPMPKIDDMKDLFLNAEWFTTIDIASGFYHIEVAEEDRFKTAFSTINGHYEWNRMPFGLKNAPVIFQRVIANLLQKHEMTKFALNYIDDIIIFSKTFSEHLVHLRRLFEVVKAENVQLKFSKCQFAQRSVVYLGFQVAKNSVSPLNSQTRAIEMAAPPKNVRDLRGFLGKVNYYHRFIPNRAALLYPLYQLLRKNVTYDWDEECQTAFEKVKTILISSPVLRIFDPKHRTILYTDASQKGLGAILKQVDPDDLTNTQYVVGYFSKSLLDYQKGYSATELELLAIISAIEYWHFYLVGQEFTVITDHMPLKSIGKLGKPNTRLFNWSIRLRQYNFKVEYRAGNKNQEADYLSRNPVALLEEITSGAVNWVDADRISNAQALVSDDDVPKKVKIIKDTAGRKLVYQKADQMKEYLPDDLARNVLEELHLRLGHIGQKKMELQFVRKYYNPNLAKHLKQIVQECEICLHLNTQRPAFGELGVIGPARAPFEIVHIDTKSGFRGLGTQKDNLHLAIDAFTRFVWYVASTTKTYVDFINLINKVMTVEKPKLIVADNYPAIKGKHFQEFLFKNQIGMVFVSPNHPSSNGMVERVNQTITNRLRAKRLERPDLAWSTQVRDCVDEYNHSIHLSTGYTPSYLMTGMDEEGLFEGENLQESRVVAFQNSNASHHKSAVRYNQGKVKPQLGPGDMVYVQARHQLNRGNLEPKYEGPYKIIDKIGRSTVEVCKNGKTTRYHVSQLKVKGSPVLIPRVVSQVLTMITCLALLVPVMEGKNLTIASPLLWKKTEHLAVVGYNFTTHIAKLMSPCTAFDKINATGLTNGTLTSIQLNRLVCDEAYESQVMMLIRKGCEVREEVGPLGFQSHHLKRRNRRVVPLLLYTMAGIISYGVMTIAHTFSSMAVERNLKKMDDQIANQLNQVHRFNEDSIKVQEEMVKKMELQFILSRKSNENFRVELHYDITLNMILNTINMMELHLGYLLYGFQSGKVTPDYRMLFKDSPLLKSDTPLSRWTAHTCQLVKDNYFVMRFEIPIIDHTIKILKASSFYVVKENEKGEQCMTTFAGNQFVIWDRRYDCTRDLLFEPTRPAELILVNTEHHTCVEHANRTSHWKEVQCGKKLVKRSFVQLKQDDYYFYVYCYQHELKVTGFDAIICENVVYQFSRYLTFAIDDNVWEINKGEYRSTYDLGADLNKLINQRTFLPEIGNDTTVRELSALIQLERVDNSFIKWKKTINNPIFYWPTLLGIGLLLIIILAYLGWKTYDVCSPTRQFKRRTGKILAMRSMMRT